MPILRSVLLICLATMIPFLVSAQDVQEVEPGETERFYGANSGDFTEPTEDVLQNGAGYFGLTTPLGGQRAEAWTIITIGAINGHRTAFGRLDTVFQMTGEEPTVLGASVSMDVEWDGILYGAGVLGAKSSVTIVADLYNEDTGQVTGSAVVLDKELDSGALKGISVGGNRIRGNKTVVFSALVTRGDLHSIRLKVECESNSGLVGADIGCDFASESSYLGVVSFPPDRFVNWTDLALTVEVDINEKLDQLLEGQEELRRGQEELKRNQEDLREGQQEIIRLLHTPQGQRQSDEPACDGEPCDFPEETARKGNGRKR